MAKGAKKKTKWVSLSLANANTKTSIGNCSDSDQGSNQQHHYAGGQRSKTFNDTSQTIKESKESAAGTGSTEMHHGSDHDSDRRGNQTDTSGSAGHDSATGPGAERRSGAAGGYQKRRPPPYHTRSNWNGSGAQVNSTNGRSHYNRTSGYSNGSGYYGVGRRAQYDSHTRRQQSQPATNRTTSGEEGNAIKDDEYTRITTPRQDVLFKKGYLSRPKPSVTSTTTTASTSNGTTASSSVAGTTSEGSDGGNGGSNSISTTESITSEYGGSYAADGTPLYDYSIPCIPCGYFTEKGVLVMNGFAVDNNGFSYFNGGQTYIYPPNYSNCQQPSTMTTTAEDPTMDSSLYPTNDETNANELNNIDPPTSNFAMPVIDPQSVVMTASGLSSMEQAALCEVVPERTATLSDEPHPDGTPTENVTDDGSVMCPHDMTDLSEDGLLQYTNGYEFTQFYNSMCFPGWMMEQYHSANMPVYCSGDYALMNEDMLEHPTSFKKRKKRTFDEVPCTSDTSYEFENSLNALEPDSSAVENSVTDCVANSSVPCGDAFPQTYHLNAEVQEFKPHVTVASVAANDGEINNTGRTMVPESKKPPSGASKHPRSSSKATPTVPTLPASVETVKCATVASTVTSSGRSASSKANRKKDLIESTLAFAAQNIDLSRPKASASVESSQDSELCWTTIERNGRKKRLPQQQDPASAKQPEKESLPETCVKEEGSVVEKVPSESLVESPSVPDVGSDGNGKKEQPHKSKRKTQKHKRQQLRKSVTSFHKQPLEGFQLIEPEFPSSTTGHRRGRSCDNAAKAVRFETSTREESQKSDRNMSDIPSSTIQEEHRLTDGYGCVVEEEGIPEGLNYDNVSASAPFGTTNITEELGHVEIAVPSTRMDDGVIVNETDTKQSHNCRESNDEIVQDPNEPDETEITIETETETIEVIDLARCAKEETAIESVEAETTTQDELMTHECEVRRIPLGNPDSKPISSSETNDVQPTTDMEVPVETQVLTSAAKQLTLGAQGPTELPLEGYETEEHGDSADDGSGLENNDARTKRDSVSGAGYTESIDSGLQSPAPCCGVTSLEVSSMVSSIESQPEMDVQDATVSQSSLSLVVENWLLRKLEVHDPEEVLILPSDPSLLQRLEQFHQLQRRVRRDRLHKTVTSESEEDDEEFDLDEEDTDSDYMSDGQGRVNEGLGDTANMNLGSPLISSDKEDRVAREGILNDVQESSPSTENPQGFGESSPAKRNEIGCSNSDRNNVESRRPLLEAASSATESKRCLIM